jgi:lipopolysaccharide export system permease protein
VLAVATAIFSLAWREFVLPEANTRRSRVWEVEIHGKADTVRPTRDIAVIGEDRRLYFARKYDPMSEEVTGLKILATDGSQVIERIDAQRAVWDGVHWRLYDGTHRVFEADSEITSHFEQLTVADLAITPAALYSERVRQEDMNIRQLVHHNRLVRQTGGDPTTSTVDIHFQFAFPLVNVIVVFLGVILASGPRKTTIASGFGLTVLVAFGYYLFMNFGRALGHNGAIPPIVAAWTGNAVYALVGWVMYAKARR